MVEIVSPVTEAVSNPMQAAPSGTPQQVIAAAVSPIAPGAILATINQTMAATGFGRTKVNALVNAGTLVARKVGRSTRIEVASILALGSAEAQV